MDELNINSKFMTGLIGRVLEKRIKKGLGAEVNVNINKVRVTTNENNITKIHLDVDADMMPSQLNKVLDYFGM